MQTNKNNTSSWCAVHGWFTNRLLTGLRDTSGFGWNSHGMYICMHIDSCPLSLSNTSPTQEQPDLTLVLLPNLCQHFGTLAQVEWSENGGKKLRHGSLQKNSDGCWNLGIFCCEERGLFMLLLLLLLLLEFVWFFHAGIKKHFMIS